MARRVLVGYLGGDGGLNGCSICRSDPRRTRYDIALPILLFSVTTFAVDGELEIRKRMNLSLSCDHRVVGGWDGANFMQDLKKFVENPLKLLSA